MFVERYVDVMRSIRAGITTPPSESFRQLVDSRCVLGSAYNPEPDNILDELMLVLEKRDGNPRISKLKSELGVPKSVFMAYFASFADTNCIGCLDKLKGFSEGAFVTIESIERQYWSTNKPVGVGGQFEIALQHAGGDISKAVMYLAMGTRFAARMLDSRLFVGREFDYQRAVTWKSVVRPFGLSDSNSSNAEDTAGNTYHFWHGVGAGIGREEKVDMPIIRQVKQAACDLAYPYNAAIVDFLRHKLWMGIKTWNIHPQIDYLGYQVGRAITAIYSE